MRIRPHGVKYVFFRTRRKAAGACDVRDAIDAVEGLRQQLETAVVGAVIEFVTIATAEGWSFDEIDADLRRWGYEREQTGAIPMPTINEAAELRRAGGARHEGFATVLDESTALAYRQAGFTSSNETRRALIEADVDSATILLFEIESWQRRLSTGLDHLKPFIRNRIAAGHARKPARKGKRARA